MVAQKWNKKQTCWQKCSAFSNICYPKTQLIKAFHSLDSSRPHGRLSENWKTEGPRELFLPENDIGTCYTVNFLKKHPGFGDLETKPRHKNQIFFEMSFHIWTQYNKTIILGA